MDRFVHRATRFSLYMSGVSLFALAFITVLEIVLRYSGNPTSWANDFIGYGLAFCLFLAFPEVTRVKGHVAITFLVDNLPNRVSLVRVMNVLAFLVIVATIYISVHVFFAQIETGVQTVSATPIPKYYLSAGLIFGLSLAALEFFIQVIRVDQASDG